MALTTHRSVVSVLDAHAITIRDLRPRFGAPEAYASRCACGWAGRRHDGRRGERLAMLDGERHRDDVRFGTR